MNIQYAQLVSVVFMTTLLTWSVVWITVAASKLKNSTDRQYLWKTHLYWCLVNAVIAAVSLVTIFTRDTFDVDYVTMQKNIVLVNVFLDVIYAVIAIVLMRQSSSKYTQIGKALMVQAVFLFVLDIVIVLSLDSLLQ